MRVASGDIYVNILLCIQTVDNLFEAVNLLNLIKENIVIAFIGEDTLIDIPLSLLSISF